MVRGNRQKAEQAFLEAVKASPDSPMAHLALGNFYWSGGDPLQAEQHLFKAASLDAKASMPRRALALLYLTTGRAAQAETHLQDLARLTTTVEDTVLLSDYYVLLGKPERAEETLLELERTKGQLILTRLRLARLHYQMADKAEAYKIVETILQHQPNLYDALLHARTVAACRGTAGRSADARQGRGGRAPQVGVGALPRRLCPCRTGVSRPGDRRVHAGAELNPRATPARIEMARIYMEEGAGEDALNIAEEAVRVDPGSADARLAHARALIMQRDYKRAQQAVGALLASHPKAAAVQALAGSLQMLKQDPRAARAAFERAASLDPNAPEAIAGLVQPRHRRRPHQGRAGANRRAVRPEREIARRSSWSRPRRYIADGAFPQAEKALRTLIDVAPTNMDAYGMLGRLYMGRARTDTGFQELLTASAAGKVSVGAATMAAMLVQAQGQEADARVRYQRILQRNPRAAIAANNLAWSYAHAGDNLEDALRLAKTAYEELPNRPRGG